MESLRARAPGPPHYLHRKGTSRTAAVRVEATEFCALAISGRSLVRCDDGPAGMRGLVDMDTGERFVVEESKLFAFAISGN